eukprot:3940641-Rhodomonas_salina.2
MRCPVLSYAMLLPGRMPSTESSRSLGFSPGRMLRSCYAMSCTDARMLCPCYAMSGTKFGYAATSSVDTTRPALLLQETPGSTDLAHAGATVLRPCYAMLAYSPTPARGTALQGSYERAMRSPVLTSHITVPASPDAEGKTSSDGERYALC